MQRSEDNPVDNDDDNDHNQMDEDEPEQQPKSKGKGKAAATPKSGAKAKYPPLEQQYLVVLHYVLSPSNSTGEVIYDSSEDGVEHVKLIELILPLESFEFLTHCVLRSECKESLSSSTERLLAHWASRSECKGNVVRMERLKGAFLDASPARVHLTDFYERPLKQHSHCPVIICLSALLHHLVDFRLEHVLLLTKGFTPFSQIGHMVLSGTTLKALEIFETEDGGSGAKGTLMWVLDHTVTKFGGRLLRRWVSRPLVDVNILRERIGAVEEVIEFKKEEKLPIVKMRGLLCQLPAPSTIRGLVERYLSLLDQEACTKNTKRDIFTLTEDETVMTDARKEVKQLKEELKECEGEFGGVLEGIRKVLKKRDVEFVVSGVEYMVEVKVVGVVVSVPKDCLMYYKTYYRLIELLLVLDY
ncbi:Mismatch repair protein msh3 [Rhizoclosmatium sp. JEL0117]|nr:Mismatch repair protein msh3 [Rhizoclosmatium sp. JEL0117]